MGVPPPVFWTQIPCFLEVTERVALQNIENKEVPCKIFLDKELRGISASVGCFRLTGGTLDKSDKNAARRITVSQFHSK
jgi:hypothetical protein